MLNELAQFALFLDHADCPPKEIVMKFTPRELSYWDAAWLKDEMVQTVDEKHLQFFYLRGIKFSIEVIHDLG